MVKRRAFNFLGLGILLVVLSGVASAQQLTALAEVSTGEGTLQFDHRKSVRIKGIAVFLRDNGETEIWLMTGRQNVYAGGRWFRGSPANRAIDFEITNDTQEGRATGGGTILLQEGCEAISKLTMTMSRLDGTRFTAEFVTKNSSPCPKLDEVELPNASWPNFERRPAFFQAHSLFAGLSKLSVC